MIDILQRNASSNGNQQTSFHIILKVTEDYYLFILIDVNKSIKDIKITIIQ